MFIVLIIIVLYSLTIRKLFLEKSESQTYIREIPTEDSPAYVGKIIKGHVDGNDIVATILDLSQKGYIKIYSEKNKFGKEEKVLELKEEMNSLKLQEHELFLVNRIFQNKNKVIFEEYVKSERFKLDFKAFDEMLSRKQERHVLSKNSKLKNVNKILLLSSFMLLGTFIFYAILAPIIGMLINYGIDNKKSIVLINITISSIIHAGISYLYITYISKSTSMRENINLRISYIVLSISFAIVLIVGGFENISLILIEELVWYRIGINCIVALIVLLYMFNIIKHNDKNEWLYFVFIVLSIIGIIFSFDLLMCLCIIFFITYIFFKSPKHTKLKEEDYIYKWEAFKRFLEDYSLLGEQEENAILIWEKYLVYAISLGINKKIIKKYGRLNKNILIDEKYFEKFYIEYVE